MGTFGVGDRAYAWGFVQNVRVFRGRAFGLGLFCVLRSRRAAKNVRVRAAVAWRSGYNPNTCSGFRATPGKLPWLPGVIAREKLSGFGFYKQLFGFRASCLAVLPGLTDQYQANFAASLAAPKKPEQLFDFVQATSQVDHMILFFVLCIFFLDYV